MIISSVNLFSKARLCTRVGVVLVDQAQDDFQLRLGGIPKGLCTFELVVKIEADNRHRLEIIV